MSIFTRLNPNDPEAWQRDEERWPSVEPGPIRDESDKPKPKKKHKKKNGKKGKR